MPNIVCLSPDGTSYTADVNKDENLLDALLLKGHDIPYCCMVGICGMCKADVGAGQAVMDDNTLEGLTAEERQMGRVLLCRARAASDCTFTLVHQHVSQGSDSATAMVSEVVEINPRWVICQLRLGQRAAGFDLRPGQHALLEWPGTTPETGILARAYAGSRTDGVLVDFYLDRQTFPLDEPTALRIGSTLNVQAPSGMAASDLASRGPALLVGAGPGVVPWASAWEHLDGPQDKTTVTPFLLVPRDDALVGAVMARLQIKEGEVRMAGLLDELLAQIADHVQALVASGVSPKLVRVFVYAPQDITAAVRKALLVSGLAPWKITVDAVTP